MEGTDVVGVIFSFITMIISVVIVVLYVQQLRYKSCCDECDQYNAVLTPWWQLPQTRYQARINNAQNQTAPPPPEKTEMRVTARQPQYQRNVKNIHLEAVSDKNAFTSPQPDLGYSKRESTLPQRVNPELAARMDGAKGQYMANVMPPPDNTAPRATIVPVSAGSPIKRHLSRQITPMM